MSVFTLYNEETVKNPEPFIRFPPVEREIERLTPCLETDFTALEEKRKDTTPRYKQSDTEVDNFTKLRYYNIELSNK